METNVETISINGVEYVRADAAKSLPRDGERAVLVTTEHRGVFFGYATETDGEIIALRSMRNCIYWSKDLGGFVGLAEKGPSASCRIGARADAKLRGITCVLECTAAATKAWEAAPCVS